MLYNSRHVSTLFGIAGETVRAWSEEFVRYLSPTANPGKGRHRSFTETDMSVFSLVSEMKSQGRTYEDIHVSLASGQRGMPPALHPEEVQAIVVSEQEKRLSLEVEYLQRAMMKIQQELEDTRKELEKVRELERENIRLQTALEHTKQYDEQRIANLTSQVDAAQKQITELLEKHGKLEREIGESYVRGVMEALDRKGDLPRRDQSNNP